MDVKHYQISVSGPVRPKNEDCLAAWVPEDPEAWRSRGAVLILADGVGGQGDGDIASRIACHVAMETFRAAKPETAPTHVLRAMFNAANLAVYDQGLERQRESGSDGRRMATTLTISILRNNEVHVGHVGDCRVYHMRNGGARRITSDHSYAGVQLKLGLITVNEAAGSELRCVLTRSVGQDPTIRMDYHTFTVNPGDFVVQCCDGMHAFISEQEIYGVVTRWPEMACQELIDLVERRHGDDNISVQFLHVKGVERLTYYRGLPIYQEVKDLSMDHEIEPGQILDGRYEILDVISRSGMASIFKAADVKENRRTVALKVPLMKFESDPGFYSRFKREQEIGTRLHHPYVLRVEPEDAERSRPYLVMEYLEGQTLGHLMKSVKPLPVGDALKIASRVCEALWYLHEHDIVHRDLKPDNIMICNDGSIRIMDFGIAKVEGARRLTFGGFQPAMGTPDYMAPEQVRGKRGDARTDIYSLGAILYEMVTGCPPFDGANPLVIMNARLSGDPVAPRHHNPKITAQVEEIILKAMSRDAGDRYPSARDFKEDLDHPEAVKLTGRAERLVKPSTMKTGWRRMRMLILAVLVPVIVVAIFYLSKHIQFK